MRFGDGPSQYREIQRCSCKVRPRVWELIKPAVKVQSLSGFLSVVSAGEDGSRYCQRLDLISGGLVAPAPPARSGAVPCPTFLPHPSRQGKKYPKARTGKSDFRTSQAARVYLGKVVLPIRHGGGVPKIFGAHAHLGSA